MRPDFLKSLQEICVDSIVKHFDQFMAVFNSENGSIPHKHFEFLQRTYSVTILEKLSATDALEDTFLNFLINPYLKKLDLRSNCFQNPDIIIDRLKVMGSGITTVDMREKYFQEDTILELISLVPNAEALYLSQTESTDKTLSSIGQHCSHLHTLDMCFCKITEEGLTSLCEKDENGKPKPNNLIKNLHIAATSVSGDGVIFALTHFPSLEVLDHDNVGRTIYNEYRSKFLDGTLSDVTKYNLTKLDLYHLGPQFGFPEENIERLIMTDILKVCSVLCPRVVSLYVDNVIIQEEVLACSEFTHLKDVKLCSSHLVDYSPLLKSSGQSLVKIELDSGVVSVEVLSKFCPKLENLTLQSINFDKFTENFKNSVKGAAFPKMISLTLEGMEFIDDVAETAVFLVKSSPALEYLYLPYSRCLSDSQFIPSVLKCECMATLRKLDFSFSDMNSGCAKKFLLATQNLEKMVIEDCDISSTEYQEILLSLKAENRAVEVIWRNGSPDYESDYENDYEFLHYEYPFREYYNDYDFDYIHDYDDDDDYYDIDTDDFDYDINDYI